MEASTNEGAGGGAPRLPRDRAEGPLGDSYRESHVQTCGRFFILPCPLASLPTLTNPCPDARHSLSVNPYNGGRKGAGLSPY